MAARKGYYEFYRARTGTVPTGVTTYFDISADAGVWTATGMAKGVLWLFTDAVTVVGALQGRWNDDDTWVDLKTFTAADDGPFAVDVLPQMRVNLTTITTPTTGVTALLFYPRAVL